jgi:polyphosphate kinase 2 (PPK2 family)
MGFCTKAEQRAFLDEVPAFEEMLMRAGVVLIKYYLDVSRAEQRARLAARRKDPLSQWKLSPIDAAAQKKWKAYSKARDEMLASTHTARSPWTIVRADDKRRARLAVIRDLLDRVEYDGAARKALRADRSVLMRYSAATAKQLAR